MRGVEPRTSRSRTVRSAWLSYTPNRRSEAAGRTGGPLMLAKPLGRCREKMQIVIPRSRNPVGTGGSASAISNVAPSPHQTLCSAQGDMWMEIGEGPSAGVEKCRESELVLWRVTLMRQYRLQLGNNMEAMSSYCSDQVNLSE